MRNQCEFCGAEHPGPNKPGSCVMFWQHVGDRYRDALIAITRLKTTDPLGWANEAATIARTALAARA